jgi:predicted permease
MVEVINLALPFFGLIFIGYACGRFARIPYVGLTWMNFFVIYIALPVLFYRIVSRTPFEQLNNLPFIAATTLATFAAFALSFGIAMLILRGNIANATIAGLAGSYGNIGYMGPGLALATLGPAAAVPVALIFCFDNILLFSLVPGLMAIAGSERRFVATALRVLRQIALHPFIIATFAGVAAAAVDFAAPVAIDRLMQFLQDAAAPCALFMLGVTVALRPVARTPWEVPLFAAVKLLFHPLAVLMLLSLFGRFDEAWVYTAVLMAALPTALNVFVMARQYDAWVEQASSSVVVGTLISVVTLTTVMWLVKTRMIPVPLFP